MTVRAFGRLLLHDWMDLRRNVTLWVMIALPLPLSVFIVRLSDASGAPVSESVPMWVLFAQVMIGIMTLVLNYVDEKEKRTLEALALTTVGHREIAAAKMVFVFVLSVAGQLLVLALNDAYVGTIPLLLGLVALGGAVFVATGMVIAAFVDTERTGGAVASAAMVLLFLSGVVYGPNVSFAVVLQGLPSVLSINLVEDAMRGHPVEPALVAALAAWLLAFLGAAEWKLRRDLRRG